MIPIIYIAYICIARDSRTQATIQDGLTKKCRSTSGFLRCQLSGPRTKVVNLRQRRPALPSRNCYKLGMVAEIPTRSGWYVWCILRSWCLEHWINSESARITHNYTHLHISIAFLWENCAETMLFHLFPMKYRRFLQILSANSAKSYRQTRAAAKGHRHHHHHKNNHVPQLAMDHDGSTKTAPATSCNAALSSYYLALLVVFEGFGHFDPTSNIIQPLTSILHDPHWGARWQPSAIAMVRGWQKTWI